LIDIEEVLFKKYHKKLEMFVWPLALVDFYC